MCPQNISSDKKGRLQTVRSKKLRKSGRLMAQNNTKKAETIIRNRYRPIQPKPTLQFGSNNTSKYVTITINNELQCFKKENTNYVRVSSYKLQGTDAVSHTSKSSNPTPRPTLLKGLIASSVVNSLSKNCDQGKNYCCTLCCKYNITLQELGQHVQCGAATTQTPISEASDTIAEIKDIVGSEGTNKYYCSICKEESITVEEWSDHIHTASQCHKASGGVFDQPELKHHIKCIPTGEETSYLCTACNVEKISIEDLPHHISLKCSPTNQVIALDSVDIQEVQRDYEDMVHPTIRYGNKEDVKLLHINCHSKNVGKLKTVNYSCTVCNESKMTINQMFNHITCKPVVAQSTAGFPKDLFACSHCGNTYRSKVSLRNHIMKHSQNDGFYCNFCDKGFPFKYSLKKHLLNQHNEVLKIFKCCMCNEAFPSKRSLKKHENQHNKEDWPQGYNVKLEDNELDENGYLCSMCGKSFTTRSNLRSHEVRMHNTKPKKHICELCGRGFDHAVRLRLHLMKHSGTKNVICEVCGRRFYQNSELYKHMTCHSQERPFVCKLCNGTFKRRCNLMTHEAMMHGIVPEGYKSHPCPVCGKTFLIAKLLADHMISHSGEKFCCSKCSQEFVDKRSYTYHIKNDCKPPPLKRKAPNKKPQSRKLPEGRSYQCKVCGKIFKASSNLGQHVRKVHEKDKYEKFCCTICGKLFKWKVSLDEHVRIHLNLKPCICKICNKAFRTWSSLARHKKVHEELRAYQCQLCGKAFRQQGHLRVHMRIHSGIKPYPCGICERSFMYNNERIKHESKMHNIITEIQ